MAKRRRRRETRKSKRDSTDVKIEDRSLIDYVPDKDTGYPSSAAAADTPENLAMLGPAVRDFPDSLWIEPKDWKDAARDNDKYKLWGEDVKNRFTNQNPTHECTCHALARWRGPSRDKGRVTLFCSPKSLCTPRLIHDNGAVLRVKEHWQSASNAAGCLNRSGARRRSSSTHCMGLLVAATTTTPAVRGFPCRSSLTGGKRQR